MLMLTCGAYGERRGVYRILVGKPEEKRPLGRSRHRSEDNIKTDYYFLIFMNPCIVV
jgi:hypothetical protein